MKYFQFNKLVRDRIVESMRKNNQKVFGVRKLNNKEYIEELKKKLKEEVDEFLMTSDRKKLKEELVDVLEVIDYLNEVLGIKETEIKQFKKRKNEKSGGFKKRIYLGSIGMEEDNEWFEYYMSNKDKYPPIKKP